MTDRIEKQIELKAPVSRVWQALTNYREFGAWFRVNIEAPFAVGQVSRGHMTYPGYEHIAWNATITAMDAERCFAYRWHPNAVDQSKDYSGEPTTLVEFLLEPHNGGTRLTLIESGFDGVPESRRAEAYRGNERGWTGQLKNIETYLETHAGQPA